MLQQLLQILLVKMKLVLVNMVVQRMRLTQMLVLLITHQQLLLLVHKRIIILLLALLNIHGQLLQSQ